MALLDEIDPPSLLKKSSKEKTKNLNVEKGKNQIYSMFNTILAKARNFSSTAKNDESKTKLANFLLEEKTEKHLVLKTGGLSQGLYILLKRVLLNKEYLPHTVLVFLALAVTGTNYSQKMIARAYSDEVISVNPDIKYSVADSISPYTPLINNAGDEVQKSIAASATSEGFVSNVGSVATEVTDRNPANKSLPAGDPTDNSDKTIEYVVKNGDTLTGLGWQYEVKIATLKYVNNIDNENMLKPGLKIKIPQKGYEVSSTLIAKKEKEKQAKLAAAQRNTVTRNSSGRATGKAPSGTINHRAGSKINGYPYGYCTYYVATKRSVPSSMGDAKQWLGSARSAGMSTGSEPAAGAIVVTTESWWGHVAYVESVDGDQITISEMNARGWGVTSRRTIPAYGGVVRGYIY